jgi:phosphoribosylpyrophosphate synthetase
MASSLGTLLAQMEHRLGSSLQQSQPHLLSQSETPDTDTVEPHPQQLCYDQSKNEIYHVIYHSSMKTFAERLESRGRSSNKLFQLYKTNWGKFEDGTDNITLGYTKNDNDGNALSMIDSPTYFKGKDLLFVASFHSNDVTMSQFHVLAHLCESFAKSLTVLLPFYSTATMERVDINHDGVVPTASTLARFFNGLPSMGYPIRLMTYDLHTLQNRFYVTGHAIASLHTATNLIRKKIKTLGIDTLAFPDAGARKRFSSLFKEIARDRVITCEKVRIGEQRLISVIDGSDLLT